jgi:hypothetical protein
MITPQPFWTAFKIMSYKAFRSSSSEAGCFIDVLGEVSAKIRHNDQVATVFVDECYKHRSTHSEFADIIGQSAKYQPLTYASRFLLLGTTWEKGPDDLKLYITIL